MDARDGAEALAETIGDLYKTGQDDYTMPPLVRTDEKGAPYRTIRAGDTVVFCCRRGEREIELTEMFTDPAFDRAERAWIPDLRFVTLTRYHEKFSDVPVAFGPITVRDTLASCISRAGRTQFHCAESEKYAHVTFFLNGGVYAPFPGETDETVPTVHGDFEANPEMSATAVADRVIGALGQYDFAVVNFANGDVIGHVNSCQAKIRAAEAVSRELGRLAKDALAKDYVVLVTADHGNLEIMTKPDGTPHVSHTTNLVPFLLLDARNEGRLLQAEGSLANVAPTVLHAMGIERPASMTADSIVDGYGADNPRRVLLVILDGWGLGAKDATNPIHLGNTPDWDALSATPHAALRASGSAVGLGADKSGNSEAGHLNIGAGRVVPQDDVRIDAAISDGSFGTNPVLAEAVERVRTRGGALHLIGILSEQSSHGSIAYPLAVCRMARDLKDVYLHLIVDGRSTVRGSSPAKIRKLAEQLDAIGTGEIITCTGRDFALDRDRDYEKVKRAYDAMTLGKGVPFSPQDLRKE